MEFCLRCRFKLHSDKRLALQALQVCVGSSLERIAFHARPTKAATEGCRSVATGVPVGYRSVPHAERRRVAALSSTEYRSFTAVISGGDGAAQSPTSPRPCVRRGGEDAVPPGPAPLVRSIICSTPTGPRKFRLNIEAAELPERALSVETSPAVDDEATMANRIASELEWYMDHVQGGR